MLIHGSPIAADFPSDPSFKERFWYWSGASGRKYIHSVYNLDHCPPLPGAIYVAVRREGHLRIAVGIGRFTPFWDGTLRGGALAHMRDSRVDEIHVHLLSKSPEAAEMILSDLLQAFESGDDGEEAMAGFTEASVSAGSVLISHQQA